MYKVGKCKSDLNENNIYTQQIDKNLKSRTVVRVGEEMDKQDYFMIFRQGNFSQALWETGCD